MKKYVTGLILTLLAGAVVWRLSSGPPGEVHVHCKTTKGDLEIVVKPEWSPLGAGRFLRMVDDGFFTDLPLFRCVNGFLCQFGAGGARQYPTIADDPRSLLPFKKGYLSFAGSGPNSRASQIFIALADSQTLGTQPWETPFGYVSDESFASTAAHLTTKYGDMPPFGSGPDPRKIEGENGRAYLKSQFPDLDYLLSCSR